METNNQTDFTKVYALTYTCQDYSAYCAGVFELYKTQPRARSAMRDTVEHLRKQGYGITVDHPTHNHVVLFRMSDQKEYHLYIEERIIH